MFDKLVSRLMQMDEATSFNLFFLFSFNRASLKLGLDKAVLQTMNSQQQSSGVSYEGKKTKKDNSHFYDHVVIYQNPQMNKTEIENLLKKGAYGIIMDNDEAADK